jgi:putative endonuclease
MRAAPAGREDRQKGCKNISNEQSKIVIAGLDPAIHPGGASVMAGYIYVLASRRRGTLYVGVTNDLVRRVHEHRSGLSEGFSGRYCVKNLVYLATYDDMRTAIQREKNIKHWARKWKRSHDRARPPSGSGSIFVLPR